MDRLLPDEIILRIFGYLDAADLASLQSVNSQLYTLAKDRHLWKRLFYFTFVCPVGDPASSRTGSSTLPTLREIRSLLLHQNLPSSKPILGDGDRQIHRLPRRFYSQSGSTSPVAKPDEQAMQALSSLYENGASIANTSTDHLLDWEQLFRVSINWQGGNFAVSELLPTVAQNLATKGTGADQVRAHPPQTIVRVSDSFIYTSAARADEHAAISPSIIVYASEQGSGRDTDPQSTAEHIPNDLSARAPITSFSSPGLERYLSQRPAVSSQVQIYVTEIAIDAAVKSDTSLNGQGRHYKRKAGDATEAASDLTASVLVAYSSGHASLFCLRATPGSYEVSEELFHQLPTATPGTHVVMAALHSPALVLCTASFDIEVCRIDASASGTMQLSCIQRLSSYRSFWPASLRLKKLPYHDVSKRARRSFASFSSERPRPMGLEDDVAFRVTLAYSTPTYPSSWSVSVQELVVRFIADSTTGSPSHVVSRHATAKHPFRPTPIDLRGRSMLSREIRSPSANSPPSQAPRSSTAGNRTMSLTYDDPFVVVGASDNVLEVYELLGATTHVRRGLDSPSTSLPRSATATPISQRDALRLVHRRSLHGHTGSVHSVALEDGRCVSGSADGSVMVWSLGDRSNETDSIASVMRNARRSAFHDGHNPMGARSISSTILEEQEGDEAASHMTHILTLRTPTELGSSAGINPIGEKPTMRGTSPHRRRVGPSIGQLVRSRVLDRQARGVVRWVSTAFDKIVSIVTYPESEHGSNSAAHSPVGTQYQRERVQVWSFG